MLERLSLAGFKLPTLYIAHNKTDVDTADEAGIPYVCWKGDKDSLLRCLLRPTLEKMFPYIKWNKVLGPKRKFASDIEVVPGRSFEAEPFDDDEDEPVSFEEAEPPEDYHAPDEDGVIHESADIAAEERVFTGEGWEGNKEALDLETYMGDLSSCVNMEVLQTLKLMPSFVGDIMDCIKSNVSNRGRWTEGYTKKLGVCLGNFNRAGELPNLMILDVSGSIPRGISATMIQLIDTLRSSTHSDLIITASTSKFYAHDEELPSPQDIREEFGYGNESSRFERILKEHVAGRRFGHVISFGDNDTPGYDSMFDHGLNLGGTKVNQVHSYHTGKAWGYSGRNNLKDCTGYSKWTKMLDCDPVLEYDTSWCKVIADE